MCFYQRNLKEQTITFELCSVQETALAHQKCQLHMPHVTVVLFWQKCRCVIPVFQIEPFRSALFS